MNAKWHVVNMITVEISEKSKFTTGQSICWSACGDRWELSWVVSWLTPCETAQSYYSTGFYGKLFKGEMSILYTLERRYRGLAESGCEKSLHLGRKLHE